ncbi:MAG: ABC transporter substrate-binding protein [Rhodospirillales bacterium]|nr:ABC transporter substrate-binding protein [Rhodospirillales bacterium]
MNSKTKGITKRISRRELLKTSASALAVGAAVSALPAPAVFGAARTIKIGMVSPETGPIAAFGEADQFVLSAVRKALKDGIKVGGQTHPVEIIYKDSQSNPNRASEVAAQLINKDRVDIMIASSTSDTTNPVADQCELNGVPCVTSDDPWQAYFFGRRGNPKTGFKWTYHFFWGFDQVANLFADMWLTIPNNKIVATMFTNDPDGIAANGPHGMPPAFRAKGFDVRQLGLYPPLSDDFTAQIRGLKKNGSDIACGIFNPPQFATFWTQCAQQGYRPKIMTPPKAVLFPTAVEALGKRGEGISTEVWWSQHHPYRSGLTGETAQQFCDAYTAATGKQWTQPIGFKHANIEVAIDALKRSASLKPADILKAITETDYKSLVGPITWKGGPLNPVKNVCTTPLVGGQWKKGKKFAYDLHTVFNGAAKDIPLDSSFEAIKYS